MSSADQLEDFPVDAADADDDDADEHDDINTPITVDPSIDLAKSDFNRVMNTELSELLDFFTKTFVEGGSGDHYVNVSQRHRQRMLHYDLCEEVDMYGLAGSTEIVQRAALDHSVAFIEVSDGGEPRVHMVCKPRMVALYDQSPNWTRAATSIILHESESSFQVSEQNAGRSLARVDPDNIGEIIGQLKTNKDIVLCFEKGIVGEKVYNPAVNWVMQRNDAEKQSFKNIAKYYIYIANFKRDKLDEKRVSQTVLNKAVKQFFDSKKNGKNEWLRVAKNLVATKPLIA